MKFKFSTECRPQGFRRKQSSEVAYFAFDTEEVAAWTLYPVNDNLSGLDLWFKGVAEAVSINEEEVGTPTFQSVLTFLSSEFPDIDDLKLKADQ